MLHALHHIQHVVSELFSFPDEVHEEDSHLVVVFLIVDVEYIAVAELVA